jgi:hypothetical protein
MGKITAKRGTSTTSSTIVNEQRLLMQWFSPIARAKSTDQMVNNSIPIFSTSFLYLPKYFLSMHILVEEINL